MFLGSIIGWLIVGLIVGAFARVLVPGRQNIGAGLTIALGLVGALVGGFISSLLFGPSIVSAGNTAYAVDTAWPGWIMAVIGGAIVLWIATALSAPGTTTRR